MYSEIQKKCIEHTKRRKANPPPIPEGFRTFDQIMPKKAVEGECGQCGKEYSGLHSLIGGACSDCASEIRDSMNFETKNYPERTPYYD